MDTGAIPPTFLGTWCRATQARRTNSFVLWSKCWLSCFLNSIPPSPLLLYPHIWQVTLPSVLTLLPLLLLLLLLLFSLVLVFFWVFSAVIQHLSARCEQYQGWLTTALVQNCQADLTSHTKLFSFLEIVYQSRWVVLSLSWLWILLLLSLDTFPPSPPQQ